MTDNNQSSPPPITPETPLPVFWDDKGIFIYVTALEYNSTGILRWQYDRERLPREVATEEEVVNFMNKWVIDAITSYIEKVYTKPTVH